MQASRLPSKLRGSEEQCHLPQLPAWEQRQAMITAHIRRLTTSWASAVHEDPQFCDMLTYTAGIAICNNQQQMRESCATGCVACSSSVRGCTGLRQVVNCDLKALQHTETFPYTQPLSIGVLLIADGQNAALLWQHPRYAASHIGFYCTCSLHIEAGVLCPLEIFSFKIVAT